MNTMGKSSPGTASTEAGLALSTVWGYRAPGPLPPPPPLTALGSVRRCSHAGQGKSWRLHPPAPPAPGPGRGPLCPASPAALSLARTCAHTQTRGCAQAPSLSAAPMCPPPSHLPRRPPPLLPPPWSWEPLGWGWGVSAPLAACRTGSRQARHRAPCVPSRPTPRTWLLNPWSHGGVRAPVPSTASRVILISEFGGLSKQPGSLLSTLEIFMVSP